MVYLIIPIGHPDVPAREGALAFEDLPTASVTIELHMSNEQVIRHLIPYASDSARAFRFPGRHGRRKETMSPAVNPNTVEACTGLAHTPTNG